MKMIRNKIHVGLQFEFSTRGGAGEEVYSE